MAVEFCRELAEVGIIPTDMMNSIVDVSIKLSPGGAATMVLDVLLDERIYKIMDPRIRKAFTVETFGQPEPEATDV